MKTSKRVNPAGRLAFLAVCLFMPSLVGCGGGGGGGSTSSVQLPTPHAVLIGAYDPSGQVLGSSQEPGADNVVVRPGDLTQIFDYSPVGIHVTCGPVTRNANEIVEYHVFRTDFTGATSSVTITPAGALVPSPLPVVTQAGTEPLDFWDDGSDKTLSFKTLDTISGSVATVASSGGTPTVNTGIKQSLIGKRFSYTVEALYRNGQGYLLTSRVATNTVTYLQPVNLLASDFSGVSPEKVFVSLNATLAADDYILELSGTSTFSSKVTLTPYDPGLIQSMSGNAYFPQAGAAFNFVDPANGLDMTQITAKLGNPSTLYARVGVRDSRNGSDVKLNPYLYSQTVTVPAALV